MATYKLNQAGKLELDRTSFKHTELFENFIKPELPDYWSAWKEIRSRGINDKDFNTLITVINAAKIAYAVGPGIVNIQEDKHVEILPTGHNSKRRQKSDEQPLPDVAKSKESPLPGPETPETDDESIKHVFDNVIREIEKLLNRRQVLRQFIADSTTRFIENQAGCWCVTDEVRARGFKLEPVLEGIADRLDDLIGDSQDWKSLGEIAGGLSVLGLDRSWVARHIGNARTSIAAFPAHDETIGVGDGRYVNLLHLVTCGLADGRSRLDRLFGEPPLDDRRLPDDIGVAMGTMADDREKQFKLFLIRNVSGRRDRTNAENDKQVTIQFNQVKRMLATALKQHNPHYGSSEQYQQLVNLIRTDLQVEDLLLIFPSGDDPELLVSDNISVFQALGRIFDAVQANTGMRS